MLAWQREHRPNWSSTRNARTPRPPNGQIAASKGWWLIVTHKYFLRVEVVMGVNACGRGVMMALSLAVCYRTPAV